ncbi:iron-siderophore ABC transporter substrate-binding protein [Dermacoccaceae bacterium W4C1]
MQRRSFITLSAAAAATTLAACQTGSTEGGDSASAPAAGSGSDASSAAASFPVTIKHALGSTTIEKQPTKVATLGWGDQDVVASLGVVPIGCPKVTWAGNAKGSTDAFDKKVAALGGTAPTMYSDADGTPFDEVAKLQPDVILATNSGITQADYDKLSKIAPTVVYPQQMWGTSWQESLELVGKALGKSAEATKLTASLEKTIAAAVSKYPDIKGKTVAWAVFTPTDTSKFSLYMPLDNRPRMLVEDFDMKNAPMVTELAKSTKQFNAEVSSEKAPDLEADVLVFYIEKKGQDAQVKSNAQLGQIPAIKRGSYVATIDPLDTVFLSGPTPLNIPLGLPRFLPELSAAAKKA